MEVLIVVSAVGAVGILIIAGVVAWPLYFKPGLRRRYEREHHRSKAAPKENRSV